MDTQCSYNPEIMQQCIDLARSTMCAGKGGPFGAAVVKDNRIISIASNSVLSDNDPTAHAEINAIRQACAHLHTADLTGCELYATGAPCPMCMGAIMWSNIKTVYVGGNVSDAEAIGFRDNAMYKFIENFCSDPSVVEIHYSGESCQHAVQQLYAEYAELNGIVY